MKVFIVGLGLMGSSYAEKLNTMGYTVYGIDKDKKIQDKAFKDGVIKGFSMEDMLDSELVILALYPKENVKFVEENLKYFKQQILTDISGTKTHQIESLDKILPKTVRYVSHHPMAGREKSGYDHRDIKMFHGANFLIIDEEKEDRLEVLVIKQLAVDLGFKKITKISKEKHDQLVAHTSQLTHLLAVNLMLIDNLEETKDATGDSFRDLTRIAKINERMWSQLFIDNKTVLIETVDRFIESLESLKSNILNEEQDLLESKLKASKERRIKFDEHSN